MKAISLISYAIFCFTNYACSKKSGSETLPPPAVNHAPVASIALTIKSINPFIVDFKITASDQDNDVLKYTWDFGDGTVKDGSDAETFTYAQNKAFVIKVAVTDSKSSPVNVTTTINTSVTEVMIDASQKFQTMQGFGGYGAKDVYWNGGPFTSPAFINDIVNDLGITILRDNIPSDFENVNDDNDPHVTDLTKFKYNSVNDHLQYLRDLKAAGLNTLIVTSWSPPAWMKTNNNVNGPVADAPSYTLNPTSATNQLRTDMYDEFAERCVAYIKILKKETDIDVYAISLQNEPRFSEPYESCVFDGAALRDLIKVVGKRFKDEGMTTKIFMPEDVSWFDGINAFIQPILQDPVAMSYVGLVGIHGYAFNGVTAGSADAQTWKAMYNWGAPSGKPLWMTETSGFDNNMNGAIDLSKAMYTALTYGNVSAWVFWTLSTSTLDGYSLMSSSGTKSKRYYASKNFYRYVRPDAYRISASAPELSNIYPVAFKNDIENSETIILINDSTVDKAIKISGANLPAQLSVYITSETDDSKDHGIINANDGIMIPAKSIVTLYRKN